MIFGVIIGLILSTLMLFINGGSDMFSNGSIIVWVVVSGIILVWQFTRNRGGDL
jgi:hypothetical protein